MNTENLSNEELIDSVKKQNHELKRMAVAAIIAKLDEDIAEKIARHEQTIENLQDKRNLLISAMEDGISDRDLERMTERF